MLKVALAGVTTETRCVILKRGRMMMMMMMLDVVLVDALINLRRGDVSNWICYYFSSCLKVSL